MPRCIACKSVIYKASRSQERDWIARMIFEIGALNGIVF